MSAVAVAVEVVVSAAGSSRLSEVFFMEFAAVEAVSESVPFYARPVVEGAPFVPAPSAVVVPAVAATVSYVHVRPAEIKIMAARIAGVYGEMPHSGCPVQRPVKVRGGAERAVLPVKEDVAEVEVALPPVCAVEVVWRVDAHQVVQVHFISGVVLCLGQVQLVCHLVRQEQSLVARLFVAHRPCGGREGEQQ